MNELQSLADIFQNKIFRIPDYQRGYAWQDAQLRDFWEDIVNLQEGRYHYTGLLSLKVLNRAETQKLGNEDLWLLQNGFKAYHVVDGQQRLTTFIIMLNEILELVSGLPENKAKPAEEIYLGFDSLKEIRARYVSRKRPPDGLIITYMFGYENDNPSSEYLKYRVLGQPFGGTIQETYYTKNLKYAKEFFARELALFYEQKGIDGIVQLYRKLTLQLMFNIHEIEDDYDVFVAFETMNNRGKRLTNLELLKNRLIYLTTLYDKETLDETNASALRELINKAWREVYYQLGRNENALLSDDEFLRAHWIMYFAYSRKKGDDYIKFLLRKFSHKSIFENVLQPNPEEEESEDNSQDPELEDEATDTTDTPEPISEKFLKPEEIINYVNSLNEAAEFWYYTFYPEKCTSISDEEQIWLDKLNRIGLGYFRPIIAVSLIPRLGYSKEERLSFFKAVERFIFINFRMAMYQSSYKSSDYYRKTREVYTKAIKLSDVTADLNSTTDANAKDAVRIFLTRMNRRFISADGFYSWRDLKYFLYEYEYSLATKYKLEKLSWGLLTKVVKDKITVEHILPQTPTKYYWRNNFRQFTAEEIKYLSASLGNLLPLSQSINSSLQNDSFEDKKNRGYANGSHCEVEISKEQLWDAQHIYARGIKLLKFMEARWAFSFESLEQMEELLHIAFVKDGREVPEEISHEEISVEIGPVGVEEDRFTHVALVCKEFCKSKDSVGEIQFDFTRSKRRYIRFTTDAMNEILPEAQEGTNGWGTKTHYYYEIENDAGKFIRMKFVLNAQNMPQDIKDLCEKINEHFPAKKQTANWQWRCPFISKYIPIPEAMPDTEILKILADQYSQLQDFEKELLQVMEEGR